MKIKYTFKELRHYAADAFRRLFTGIGRLLWTVCLLTINAAIGAYLIATAAIRRRPCVAVMLTFLIMSAVCVFTYCSMKVRLTTADWQRQQAMMHADSIAEAAGITANYTRMAR